MAKSAAGVHLITMRVKVFYVRGGSLPGWVWCFPDAQRQDRGFREVIGPFPTAQAALDSVPGVRKAVRKKKE